MITRRGFFGLVGGFAAAEAAKKIYILPPLGGWRLSGSGLITPGEALFYLEPYQWTYMYTYRNIITGHVSDATHQIKQLAHTFAWPEADIVDIYKSVSDGGFELYQTKVLRGFKG